MTEIHPDYEVQVSAPLPFLFTTEAQLDTLYWDFVRARRSSLLTSERTHFINVVRPWVEEAIRAALRSS